jgi:hypothetical protein
MPTGNQETKSFFLRGNKSFHAKEQQCMPDALGRMAACRYHDDDDEQGGGEARRRRFCGSPMNGLVGSDDVSSSFAQGRRAYSK